MKVLFKYWNIHTMSGGYVEKIGWLIKEYKDVVVIQFDNTEIVTTKDSIIDRI